MADLVGVADARDFDGLMRALADVFDDDATLFAIDHAVDRLVEVRSTPGDVRSIPLDGPLRISLLENLSHADEDGRWFPISDRRQPVLVVRTALSATPPSDDLLALLGPLANGHRRRFEELERVRRRSSMTVAAEMQWAALPNRADLLGDFAIGSVLEPAYEVAGDAFDYAAADGAVWAYSFDGMGHGLSATMASNVALSAIRNSRRSGGGLDAQMNAASHVMFEHFGGDCFVTGLACRFDSTGVEFVNAGHEPGWAISDGHVRRLDLVAELPLGVIADQTYSIQARQPLEPGDGVAMFSDGPASSRSPDGSEYGVERLRNMLESRWSGNPLLTAHDVVGDVLDHIGEGRVTDDISAIIVQRRSGGV